MFHQFIDVVSVPLSMIAFIIVVGLTIDGIIGTLPVNAESNATRRAGSFYEDDSPDVMGWHMNDLLTGDPFGGPF